MEISASITVKGLVQGVGFRYFVFSVATKLSLRGYTRNLFNGDVEIEVEGNRSAIEALIKEVKVGPRMSRVTDLVVEWKPPTNTYKQFSIK